MKITNFKRTGEFSTEPNSPLKALFVTELATVDVTTGFLWTKKTETKEVFREKLTFWRFTETGEHTPGYVVEDLAKVYDARGIRDKFLEARAKAVV